MTWDTPTYIACLEPYDDLIYEFYDRNDIHSDQLSWLQVDAESRLITASVTLQEFQKYSGNTLQVKIKAMNANDSTMWNDTASLAIYFDPQVLAAYDESSFAS